MKILVIKGIQNQKYHCFESKIRAKELFLQLNEIGLSYLFCVEK